MEDWVARLLSMDLSIGVEDGVARLAGNASRSRLGC